MAQSSTSHLPPGPLVIGCQEFLPGDQGVVDIPIGSLIDYQPVTMAVHVRRGKKDGPCLLVSAALHGDEIVGVEIIRRLLGMRLLKGLRGEVRSMRDRGGNERL